MISKEDIKREVDRLPESLLEEAYALLKDVAKKSDRPRSLSKAWFENLNSFTADFMKEREQPQIHEERESFK